MCSGYLRRSSNVRVDMTVQTRKLDGALRDEFMTTENTSKEALIVQNRFSP